MEHSNKQVHRKVKNSGGGGVLSQLSLGAVYGAPPSAQKFFLQITKPIPPPPQGATAYPPHQTGVPPPHPEISHHG